LVRHSYLFQAFAQHERIAMDVGFYYMSNAAGRLTDKLLSGLSYQVEGLPLTICIAALTAFLSWHSALCLKAPAATQTAGTAQ
jgi:hypothetical protein